MSSVHLLTPSLDSEDELPPSDLGALTSAAALLVLRQRTDNNASVLAACDWWSGGWVSRLLSLMGWFNPGSNIKRAAWAMISNT